MSTRTGIAYTPDIHPGAGQDESLQRAVTVYNGSAAAIPANTAVFIDVSVATRGLGKAVKISTSAALGDDAHQFAGITKGAIAIGAQGEVYGKGSVCMASTAAGVTAGQALTTFHTTDGMLEDSAVGTDFLVATALEAVGATTAAQACVLLLAGL